MRKIITILILLVIIIVIGSLVQKKNNTHLPISGTVTTEDSQVIKVRVADTTETRKLGLSYFKSLPDDEGMLFLFEKTGNYSFWMKGMRFPIDIIWLKEVDAGVFEVVSIAEGVDPSTYPQTIDPKTDADAVLEINSGQAHVHNLDLKKNLWITR